MSAVPAVLLRSTSECDVPNMQERSKVFDPLFHIMSGKFDEGGARGLLLHNLSVSTSGGLVFDSCPPADTDGATPSLSCATL